jgi:hypothetical protein
MSAIFSFPGDADGGLFVASFCPQGTGGARGYEAKGARARVVARPVFNSCPRANF